jgi:cytochrome P450
MTGIRPALEFNPFLPEVHANPYPLYHRLRTEDPVHRSEAGFWVLTRHAEVATVLRDPRMSRDPRRSAQFQLLRTGDGQDPYADGAPSMLFVDPPTTPECGHWSTRRSPRPRLAGSGPGSRT